MSGTSRERSGDEGFTLSIAECFFPPSLGACSQATFSLFARAKHRKSRFFDFLCSLTPWKRFLRRLNLAKTKVFAVIHSRVIQKSVSPKFGELYIETPFWYSLEGNHMAAVKYQKHLSLSFATQTKNYYYSRAPIQYFF